MKLFKSEKGIPLPTVFFVTSEEELKEIPLGIPFIRGKDTEYEIESDGVWAYAEEYGDPERLAGIVATYQQQFDRQDGWVLSWAQTCSKMRLDEFTGGAVAVCRGTTHFVVPDRIARDWAGL